MKMNISFAVTSCQKLIEVNNEHKLRTFFEKHMATEVAADALGEEWKSHVIQVSGRNDKQGFPMKQGVLTHGRVHLRLRGAFLLDQGGLQKESSNQCICTVRGGTVDANLSVLNLVIVRKGRKTFLVSLILPGLITWGLKELAESANPLISLKMMMSANTL
ncbi:40S ribosomal protein S6 [Pteropus alecto]|uniref:Small ribosomal subunit protein eS6 n=1 Tax=Pteropus alecto TaxID=9402 RepID=L5KLC3_PTEAL|nr:40S ribosomal protein S6 [Pteropus alecto]